MSEAEHPRRDPDHFAKQAESRRLAAIEELKTIRAAGQAVAEAEAISQEATERHFRDLSPLDDRGQETLANIKELEVGSVSATSAESYRTAKSLIDAADKPFDQDHSVSAAAEKIANGADAGAAFVSPVGEDASERQQRDIATELEFMAWYKKRQMQAERDNEVIDGRADLEDMRRMPSIMPENRNTHKPPTDGEGE